MYINAHMYIWGSELIGLCPLISFYRILRWIPWNFHVNFRDRTGININISVCMFVCMSVYMYACMFVCICVPVCVSVSLC